MAKVLILDIETFPALAYVWGIWKENIGIERIAKSSEMVCWAAKWYGQTKKIFKSSFHDSQATMLKDIHKLLNEADIVVHFNGRAFDIKTINKEFIIHNMPPPAPYRQVDLLEHAHRTFNFLSYKLDYICQQLKIGKKTEHEGFGLWKKCMANDSKAWDKMREYNIHDVEITESLYVKMIPWIHNHPNIAVMDGRPKACPRCGKENTLRSEGSKEYAGKCIYKRYWCAKTKNKDGCGGWIKGERIK